MLIRLLPEQVSKNWNKLAPLISAGLNPTVKYSRQGMVNVLRAVLMEKLVCWIYSKDSKFMFIVCTHIQVDEVTLDKRLIIWSLSSLRDLNAAMLKDAFLSISLFARKEGCRTLVGYAADERLVNMCERELGMSAEFKFVEVEL